MGGAFALDEYLSSFATVPFPMIPDTVGISAFVRLEQDPAAKRKKKTLDKRILRVPR